MKRIDKIYNSLKDNKNFKNLSMDKQGEMCIKMKKIIEYIDELLENESFIGWSEDAKNGYLTACISIKEKILINENEKMSNEYNKTLKEITDERLIDDLKKFKGLPPYDGFNTCASDGYFWNDIKRRHTESEIKEALKRIKETW